MIRQNGLRSRRFSTNLAVVTSAFCALAIATGCANPTEYDIVGDDAGTGSGNAPGLGGASNAGAPGRAGASSAGASSAGAGNSSSGGSAGQSAAGGPGTGGSSSAGASSAGASSGGASAAGASSGGSAGQSSAGASSAGSSNGGATGGSGCDAVAWASGKTYKLGDAVTATCNNPGGGSTVCTSGKKYAWTCMGTGCSTFGAGGDAWWANWTLGAACN